MFVWFALSLAQDGDSDGVPDADDNCPSIANPVQGVDLGAAELLAPVVFDGTETVLVGDLDGDHDLDIVRAPVTDRSDAEFGLLVQRADGTFDAAPLLLPAPLGLARLFDLDDDGDLDALILGNAVMWNDGAGNFEPKVPLGGSGSFESTALLPIDLDGDGDLDLVNAGTERVYYGPDTTFTVWHENVGNLQFTDGVELVVRDGLGRPLLSDADIDADGDVDFAFCDAVFGEVGWHERVGPTALTSHVVTTTLTNPEEVAAGDLDGDGDVDLAVVGRDDGMVLWLEQLPGSWAEHLVDAAREAPSDLQIVDLDRDGQLDLLVAAADGTRAYLGPMFVETVLHIEPASTARAADVDDDGALDLVVGSATTDAVWLLTNRQPGDRDADGVCDVDDPCPFEPSAACVDTDGDGLADDDEVARGTDPLLADTDGDGVDDLAEVLQHTLPTSADTDLDGVTDDADLCPLGDDPDGDCVCGDNDTCPDAANPDQIDVDGDGIGDVCDPCIGHAGPRQGYDVEPSVPLVGRGYALPVDIDGDGDLDLLHSGEYEDGLTLSENLGGATFADPVRLADSAAHVLAADYDDDGDPDLVVSRDYPIDEVVVYENLGGHQFADVWRWEGAGRVTQAAAADMDGDGWDDLVLARPSIARASWLPSNGDLSFGEPMPLRNGSNIDEPEQVLAVDLDDDGDLDVVTAGYRAAGVHVVENLGDGTPGQVFRVQSDTDAVAVGDVDGDGWLDLIAEDNDVLRWLAGGPGLGFSTEHVFAEHLEGVQGIALEDVDLDGDLDVVVNEGFNDGLWWFANDGSGGFTGHRLAKLGGPHGFHHVVDLDGDGVLDVVGANRWESSWYPGIGTPLGFLCDPPLAEAKPTCPMGASVPVETGDTGVAPTEPTPGPDPTTSVPLVDTGDGRVGSGPSKATGCGCEQAGAGGWDGLWRRRRAPSLSR